MKSFLALLFILLPLCHSAAIQDSTPVAANWPRAWEDCAFNHYCDDNRDCRSQKDCLDKANLKISVRRYVSIGASHRLDFLWKMDELGPMLGLESKSINLKYSEAWNEEVR
ncbi:hypothetical protein PABG_07287 [Paracoccidioides brasiliensis Pb03]|nr:hypothetical protein PABG_07287 [Paracoccidioides brasiliensis Pb03]